MTLRQSFHPLRPDLDAFLFAEVGDEIDGVPLSVISALTRLGLDPWQEAGRLSSFGDREAAEQLARLIVDLPSRALRLHDARKIAAGLVALLPRKANPPRTPQIRARRGFWDRVRRLDWPGAFPRPSQFWIACLVVVGAALVSAVIHHGLPFGIGGL